MYTHAPHAGTYAATSAGKAAELAGTSTGKTAVTQERSWQLERAPEQIQQIALPLSRGA
ncbi:hypothetical protein [Kribbella qitaiheensis]|uniref:hypothetical protein n=1 Tax=Kribbella qitaiheensis TaxID=1544730 RepID=UPI003D18ACEE